MNLLDAVRVALILPLVLLWLILLMTLIGIVGAVVGLVKPDVRASASAAVWRLTLLLFMLYAAMIIAAAAKTVREKRDC
ncbi:MAG: hypothetical protein QXZ31_11810 [Thermofilaceae archaeon]